ncbi:FAD-dependent oxidoreductase [Candidatus Woesebacteria bacterium]|nr:FAD-dependent oxidoreductase [Candidatus Woesebacteria bacterium]
MVLTFQSKLIHKKLIAPHVYHLVCTLPDNHEWNFTAGQYMIFHIPQKEGHPVRRLYSIASPPSQKSSIDFIIEIVPNGIGSIYVDTLNEGDSLTLQGPAGIFTHKTTTRPSIYLATGTGIAPMYSMIHTILNDETNTYPVYLFWGLKNCEDLYLDEELTALAKSYPLFYLRTCFSRLENISQVKQTIAAYTELGRVTLGFEKLLKDTNTKPDGYDYYLCGSKHVVEALREYLQIASVAKEQIFFEKFT